MSDHNGMMSTPVWRILEQLATCPILIARGEAVASLSGDPDYQGRHRTTESAPLAIRAAQRIAYEWTRPRAWSTALAERIAAGLNEDQADKLYDFLSGETFRDMSAGIARRWRDLDQSAYGRLPKTWRHRLEARHRAQQILDDSVRNTELWWAGRQADYAAALGLHTPTQPLKTLEETRTP
jgi:hypothetical protein